MLIIYFFFDKTELLFFNRIETRKNPAKIQILSKILVLHFIQPHIYQNTSTVFFPLIFPIIKKWNDSIFNIFTISSLAKWPILAGLLYYRVWHPNHRPSFFKWKAMRVMIWVPHTVCSVRARAVKKQQKPEFIIKVV